MFEEYPSLLVTKLFIPSARASHIPRIHLMSLLNSGVERKLILVAAAAGFGKTTLIAEWIAQYPGSVGWLSLDGGDNDPSRFLSYLIGGVQTCYPQFGQVLLAVLQSPQPPTVENALYTLINQMASLKEHLIVVLDDYHVIENPVIHKAFEFFLEHSPRQVTIVLLSRSDPPLPLARLRAKNDLLELRAAHLRFSSDEIEHFLNQTMRLGLSAEAVRALETRTEGWIVGLQLAASAMQFLPDDKYAFIESFKGSHRFILDYLVEEVLAHQPDDVQQFLLQTSILHRLNGGLCSAIMGNNDGQRMIDYLEKNNLFVIPLDQSRYWYRYHHLFADLLQARLRAHYPERVKQLHRRAAQWYEQNHLPEEAVVYALAAEDFEYAASLLTGEASTIMRRGEVTTLLVWYKAFPADIIKRYPRLSLQFGVAFALNGRWNEAETLLENLEDQAREFPPEETLLLAYLVASSRQDTVRLQAIVEEASEYARPSGVTKLILALILGVQGELQAACDLMAEAEEACLREGNFAQALTALFHQCRLNVFAGNLQQAYQLCQRALNQARDVGDAAMPMLSFAHVSLCRICIEWNELEQAEEHALQAIRSSELSGFLTGLVSSTTMMRAEIQQARGDIETAKRLASEALTHAGRNDPPSEAFWLKTYQARLWLIQGNIPAAVGWMREFQKHRSPVSIFYPDRVHVVTQSRVLLAQHKIDEAMRLLTTHTTEPYDLFTVETLILLALARQSQGNTVHAMLVIEQALVIAESENRLRVFLDYGAQAVKLLVHVENSSPGYRYAQNLLAMLSDVGHESHQVDSLSERELQILRLIAAGNSNEEIAQSLTLALSTVKWYINTLYAKLHVKTRSQAIARAHELKLLSDF